MKPPSCEMKITRKNKKFMDKNKKHKRKTKKNLSKKIFFAGAKVSKYRKTENKRQLVEPYSINKPLEKLEKLLISCKESEKKYSYSENSKISANKRKQNCKYGETCMRENPEHFRDFKHQNGVLINIFKGCVDEFINLTYVIYINNNNNLPIKWYDLIQEYLLEYDYSSFGSLYFNILANLSIHHKFYTNSYNNKSFWSKFFMGLEEHAVTGMFDITTIPKIVESLEEMNSADTRYLSNTALLLSESYGKI